MLRNHVAACAAAMTALMAPAPANAADAVPSFRVDASWPQPLPHHWRLGQVSGVATDADDHVWVLQRPATVSGNKRERPPPVLEFDAGGRLLRHWGGPGKGYDWPASEHGIHVDHKGYVWITGNGAYDGQLLKFTRDGRFVLQIGKVGPQTGSADITRLGQAATAEVDAATNEVYVADGYHNRRVIVFDADTGAYRRHWGAYGRAPVDMAKPQLRRTGPPTAAQQANFANPVHCARVAHDRLVYVCDRLNNRIQVFKTDGTFVMEFSVAPATIGYGSVWDIALSRDPQQRHIFMADGHNERVVTLSRDTGEVVSQFGQAGRRPGEFRWVHDLAIDTQGNLYAGEVDGGKRVQRFLRGP